MMAGDEIGLFFKNFKTLESLKARKVVDLYSGSL